jgi:cell division topological specificity factor
MSLLDYFRSSQKQRRPGSAAQAKERLQMLIVHDGPRHSASFLPKLKKELLDVVRKYVHIEQDKVQVHLGQEGDCEVLELNIILPEGQNNTS